MNKLIWKIKKSLFQVVIDSIKIEFSLKVNQEQKPSLNKFNCITENKEEIIPVVKNIDQEIESKVW